MEVLRDCLPSSVRRTLTELPESLDGTYERILKEIKKSNRSHAQRVLQCLVAATRPLRVVELSEVLAVDFDDVEGIPRLKSDWWWEEQELALLSTCSSLIVIVEAGDSRVVQFSQFSVKEFLTSPRLATASRDVSSYHIYLESAHTILAQACLGVLLQIQDDVEGHTREDHPLVRYAAEHWTTHVQFGEVSSRLQKGMEYLFDPGKPHFKVWLTLYNMDRHGRRSALRLFAVDGLKKFPGGPLYYAALCGFHNLLKHLVAKYPQDVNARGGHNVSPLGAALAGKHFQTADLLRLNGADPNVRGRDKCTPLLSAVYCHFDRGDLELTLKLIEYGADVNAKNAYGSTPLHCASKGHHCEVGSVLRLLLKHGGDVNARDNIGFTPLHEASYRGAMGIVPILLMHGADVEAVDSGGWTALQVADASGHDEVVKLLREHGAR